MANFIFQNETINITHFDVYHYEKRIDLRDFKERKTLIEDGVFDTLTELNKFLKSKGLPKVMFKHIVGGLEW